MSKSGYLSFELKLYLQHVLHIVTPLVVCLVCSDVLGSWVASFTFHEIQELRNDRPVFYVICLLLLILFMTANMNMIGYLLHLFYCVFLEGGTYSSGKCRKGGVHVCVGVAHAEALPLLPPNNRALPYFDEPSSVSGQSHGFLVVPLAPTHEIHMGRLPLSTHLPIHESCPD